MRHVSLLVSLPVILALVGGSSSAVDYPIPIKVTVIKQGKLFKFVSKGSFTLPASQGPDDPTIAGGALCFRGALGNKTYVLPASVWSQRAGGVLYKAKDTVCKRVILKSNLIKGVCVGDTGTFNAPNDSGPGCCFVGGPMVCTNATANTCPQGFGSFLLGEVCGGPGLGCSLTTIGLQVGTATTRYCGACGGTVRGNPSKVYKRTDCPAPAACEPCSPGGAFLESGTASLF
jgi:hypothetical protein